MSTETVQAIHDDMRTLGFMQHRRQAGKGASGVFAIADATEDIGRLESPETPVLHTAFGARVLEVINEGHIFSHHPRNTYFNVCESAEIKLLAALGIHTLQDQDAPAYAPIVISRLGEPVAITKGIGVKSTYALVDRPELGLVARSFGLPHTRLHPGALPQGPEAYSVDIRYLKNHFYPARLSIFAIELEARKDLMQFEEHHAAITYTHEEVASEVARLFAVAHPLMAEDVARATQTRLL